jgi:hypothetical protein
MTERLIAKLDRLGAEAGIKEMTPEIYQFAQLLNDDKLKQWDEWKAKREWVDLTDTQIENVYFDMVQIHRGAPMPWGQVQFGRALLEKFKEVNT